MVDNKQGLNKLMDLYSEFEKENIDLITFIEEFEEICFNEISSDGVNNFSDGYNKACVSTLMKYVVKAYNGDEKAMDRLLIDLYIKDANFTIKEII